MNGVHYSDGVNAVHPRPEHGHTTDGLRAEAATAPAGDRNAPVAGVRQVLPAQDEGGRGQVAPSRGRRSASDVVDTALDLLDRAGLPSLSMRRIAQELGLQPSALYWHFADKQSLLAALSRRILLPAAEASPGHDDPPHDVAPPSSMRWEDAVRSAATHLRDALVAHRDGAELVSSSLALGLVELPLADSLHAPLGDAGASARTVAVVAQTLGHFVIGHTFHEQQRVTAREVGIESAPAVDDEGAPGDSFAAGVDLLVAGTAVLIGMDRG